MQKSLYKKLLVVSKKTLLLLLSLCLTNMTAVADVILFDKSISFASIQSAQFKIKRTSSPRKQSEYIPIDYTTIKISDYKLAVMHVMSEICPSLISSNKIDDFERSFQSKMSDLLPNASNPRFVLRQLSTHRNYRKIFSSMKKETLNNFSSAENKAVCDDFVANKF